MYDLAFSAPPGGDIRDFFSRSMWQLLRRWLSEERNGVESFLVCRNSLLFLCSELSMSDVLMKERNTGYTNNSSYKCLRSCKRKRCCFFFSASELMDILTCYSKQCYPRKQFSSLQCCQTFYLGVCAGENTGQLTSSPPFPGQKYADIYEDTDNWFPGKFPACTIIT